MEFRVYIVYIGGLEIFGRIVVILNESDSFLLNKDYGRKSKPL